MREVVLDTETTGLDPASGHRLVEIGCVELIHGVRTGEFYHAYLNPERNMPEEAFRIHGLSEAFLSDKPIFSEVVDDFLQFIQDSPLVIHNAGFDVRFMNHELERLGFSPLPMSRALDTVLLAKKKFPGSPASLDALCRRFEIDLSSRTKHGALLDAELLADVYLELLGGKQATFQLTSEETTADQRLSQSLNKTLIEPRNFPISSKEQEAHESMLAKLKNPLWKTA